jgi:phage gpG-like protein
MTDVPYAATHQFGLNGMIRREFLGFSEEDHELAAQLIGRRVQQQIAKVQA